LKVESENLKDHYFYKLAEADRTKICTSPKKRTSFDSVDERAEIRSMPPAEYIMVYNGASNEEKTMVSMECATVPVIFLRIHVEKVPRVLKRSLHKITFVIMIAEDSFKSLPDYVFRVENLGANLITCWTCEAKIVVHKNLYSLNKNSNTSLL